MISLQLRNYWTSSRLPTNLDCSTLVTLLVGLLGTSTRDVFLLNEKADSLDGSAKVTFGLGYFYFSGGEADLLLFKIDGLPNDFSSDAFYLISMLGLRSPDVLIGFDSPIGLVATGADSTIFEVISFMPGI